LDDRFNLKNRAYTVEIIGYAAGGEGVARLEDGRVAFVRGGARGDVCEISITSESARSCRGEIVNLLSPSGDRVKPDCEAYPMCGGCDFRHITYEEELWAKLRRLNDALARIGGVSARAEEILSSGRRDAYRNKAVFHTAIVNGKTIVGFFRAGSREVCPVTRCLLLKEELNRALLDLWRDPPEAGTEITLRTGAGRVAKSVIKRSGERARSADARAPERAATRSDRDFVARSYAGGIERSGERAASRYSGCIVETLDGITFRMSGSSFFQVNTDAALILYRQARAYAGLSADETLVDLYCGVGSLTLFVGRDARRAIGVENNPYAIADARANAKIYARASAKAFAGTNEKDNEIDNARANAGTNGLGFTKFEFALADVAAWETDIKPDCVIVDPPRQGLSSGAVSKIQELSPSRLVYISCDPATLARDINRLDKYEARKVCAVDMFPGTANVESCVLMVKK